MQMRTECAVVAVFSNMSAAEAAAGDLAGNAFATDHIHITSKNKRPTAVNGPQYRSAACGEASVRDWFRSVFDQDDEHKREYYESAVRRGKILLGLDTPEQMISTAVDVLNHHSPLEIHEGEI